MEKDDNIAYLKREIKDLRTKLEEKENKISELTRNNIALSRELEKYKPQENPCTSTIQLFHIHSGDKIKEIEEDLRSAVKLRLNKIGFINRQTHADITISQKLIVICIISSRIGTDAENAIKHIKSQANAALILIHVVESHALPYRRSKNVLTGEKFKDLGGIFDLAYMPRKGIYQCKMNNEELDGITNFIKEPWSTMIE